MRFRSTRISIAVGLVVTLLLVTGSVAIGMPAGDSASAASEAATVNLVVNTTDDTDDGACDRGHCSLREAIRAANSNVDPDSITFNIPTSDPNYDGSGVCTIRPDTPLPALSDDATTINGYSQPGATPNTNAFGLPINAVLKIVLDGSQMSPAHGVGLSIQSSDNTVRGLVIQRFNHGMEVFASHRNKILGNFIGTNARGSAAMANKCIGISISSYQGGATPSSNVIGGSAPEHRNLISGNTCGGVEMGQVSDSRIYVNYIGTDASGGGALGNRTYGIRLFNIAQGNRIGGSGQGEANLIAYNK